MTYRDYKEKMEIIQSHILLILDDNNNVEENFQDLYQFIEVNNMNDDQNKIKSILYLLSKIIDNHHRQPSFFKKIEQIFLFLKKRIHFYFSNLEIFNLFKNNKRVLLFLFESNIISFDEIILSLISKDKFNWYNYSNYFSIEINRLIEFEEEDEGNESNENEIFGKNRENGENENKLCELIRNDLIDEFIQYVNDNKISLDSKIITSIFESNLFLLKNKDTSLIEYSSFFGSINIFKYLYLKEVNVTSKIWLYAIHSNNIEIILFLNENQKDFEKNVFEKCLKEAIKCHHIEIANFIQSQFLNQQEIENQIKNNSKDNIYSYGFHYYNFYYFPKNLINNNFIFYYACEYDYFNLVELLLKIKATNVDLKIISYYKKLNKVQIFVII